MTVKVFTQLDKTFFLDLSRITGVKRNKRKYRLCYGDNGAEVAVDYTWAELKKLGKENGFKLKPLKE